MRNTSVDQRQKPILCFFLVIKDAGRNIYKLEHLVTLAVYFVLGYQNLKELGVSTTALFIRPNLKNLFLALLLSELNELIQTELSLL
jgi:hypothetical protein